MYSKYYFWNIILRLALPLSFQYDLCLFLSTLLLYFSLCGTVYHFILKSHKSPEHLKSLLQTYFWYGFRSRPWVFSKCYPTFYRSSFDFAFIFWLLTLRELCGPLCFSFIVLIDIYLFELFYILSFFSVFIDFTRVLFLLFYSALVEQL